MYALSLLSLAERRYPAGGAFDAALDDHGGASGGVKRFVLGSSIDLRLKSSPITG
jgi:hypothetical protein